MITNYVVMRDYETSSRNPHNTQPIELAACIIDVKSLSIVDDSFFFSLLKPEFDDEKAKAKGFAPVEDDALNINKITREELADAPSPKQVWKDYTNYIKKFTKGKGVWNSPHVAGYNSAQFDDVIDLRMCELYGPKPDDRKQIPIYHPVSFDLLPIVHSMFNHLKINSQNKMGMDSLRTYFGMDNTMAHRGLKDVLDCSFLFIKYLRLMKSIESGTIELTKGKKIKYEDSFKNENIIIKNILGSIYGK